MEIRIPRFSFRDTPTNGFLVLTLVIFAFLLGMLTNKVMYLQSTAKQATVAAAINPQPSTYPTQPSPPQIVKVDNGKLPLLGNANAKVTVVEFSDFQCPFCEKFFTDTLKQIDDNYIKTGKIKLAFRHYPLISIHPNAQIASEASECANEQNKFWDYHDLLFTNQAAWSPLTGSDITSSLTDYAGQVGLDTGAFATCLSSHKYKARVDADQAAGNDAQVNGTPTFFINGNRLVGAQPFSAIKRAIEGELKK